MRLLDLGFICSMISVVSRFVRLFCLSLLLYALAVV